MSVLPAVVVGVVQAVSDTAISAAVSMLAAWSEAPTTLLILGIANLVVVAVSAGFLYVEIKSNHDWNRRRTAHELIFEAATGQFRTLRDELVARIGEDLYDPAKNYATLDPPLTMSERRALEAILNYLENVCLTVKNNVVDGDIAFEAMGGVLLAYWRWAEPYVRECRKTDAGFWIQIEPIAKTWQERKDKMLTPPVAEGKRRL